MGATSAYIKAHFQEARNYNNITVVVLPDGSPGATFAIPGTPLKSEDLTYSETSSAQGTILAFTKVIAYQSGKSLL